HGQALSDDQEGIFLDAYAKLVPRVAPVTAATLRATSPRFGRRGWLRRLLGLGPVSDAQRAVWGLGLFTIFLIAFVASTEWINAVAPLISAAEKQLAASIQETRDANVRLNDIERQIEKLNPSTPPATTSLLQTLEIRRDEVQQKLWGLEYTNR